MLLFGKVIKEYLTEVSTKCTGIRCKMACLYQCVTMLSTSDCQYIQLYVQIIPFAHHHQNQRDSARQHEGVKDLC